MRIQLSRFFSSTVAFVYPSSRVSDVEVNTGARTAPLYFDLLTIAEGSVLVSFTRVGEVESRTRKSDFS